MFFLQKNLLALTGQWNNMLVPVAYFRIINFIIMKNKGGRPLIKDEKTKRNKHVGFYVTLDEYKKILERIPENITLSEGFRTIILSKNEQIYVPINFEKYIVEVNKIGTNINQIAKKLNASKEVNITDINGIKNKVAELNTMFSEILNTLNNKIDS